MWSTAVPPLPPPQPFPRGVRPQRKGCRRCIPCSMQSPGQAPEARAADSEAGMHVLLLGQLHSRLPKQLAAAHGTGSGGCRLSGRRAFRPVLLQRLHSFFCLLVLLAPSIPTCRPLLLRLWRCCWWPAPAPGPPPPARCSRLPPGSLPTWLQLPRRQVGACKLLAGPRGPGRRLKEEGSGWRRPRAAAHKSSALVGEQQAHLRSHCCLIVPLSTDSLLPGPLQSTPRRCPLSWRSPPAALPSSPARASLQAAALVHVLLHTLPLTSHLLHLPASQAPALKFTRATAPHKWAGRAALAPQCAPPQASRSLVRFLRLSHRAVGCSTGLNICPPFPPSLSLRPPCRRWVNTNSNVTFRCTGTDITGVHSVIQEVPRWVGACCAWHTANCA